LSRGILSPYNYRFILIVKILSDDDIPEKQMRCMSSAYQWMEHKLHHVPNLNVLAMSLPQSMYFSPD
jgi:hypothetical protein